MLVVVADVGQQHHDLEPPFGDVVVEPEHLVLANVRRQVAHGDGALDVGRLLEVEAGDVDDRRRAAEPGERGRVLERVVRDVGQVLGPVVHLLVVVLVLPAVGTPLLEVGDRPREVVAELRQRRRIDAAGDAHDARLPELREHALDGGVVGVRDLDVRVREPLVALPDRVQLLDVDHVGAQRRAAAGVAELVVGAVGEQARRQVDPTEHRGEQERGLTPVVAGVDVGAGREQGLGPGEIAGAHRADQDPCRRGADGGARRTSRLGGSGVPRSGHGARPGGADTLLQPADERGRRHRGRL